MVLGPTVLLVIFFTAMARVLSRSGVHSLFAGILVYSLVSVLISTSAFIGIVTTLGNIKKNTGARNEARNQKLSLSAQKRPLFITGDVEAFREGSSWISSKYGHGERRSSISGWSFSTRNSQNRTSSKLGHLRHASSCNPSNTAVDSETPPVPPLRVSRAQVERMDPNDSDPFRREPNQILIHGRHGSQSSWLTSTNRSHKTISSWSYPSVEDAECVRSKNPIKDVETKKLAMDAPVNTRTDLDSLTIPATTIDGSIYAIFLWTVFIWIPLVRAAFSSDTNED